MSGSSAIWQPMIGLTAPGSVRGSTVCALVVDGWLRCCARFFTCCLLASLLCCAAMNSPSQHFCLRWNNYQANLTCVFDQLLQSESFVDVTLAVSGFSIKAHKVILSACSPFFKAMLCDNPCEHPIVVMRDVGSADMLAIVQFMYKGEISVSQEQLPGLLKVAEMLKIRGLADVPDDADMPPTQLRPAGGAGSPAQRHQPSPLRRSASCDTSPPPRAQGTPESLETSVDLPLMTSSSRSTPSPLLAASSATTASRPPASITMTTASGMSISAAPAIVSQPPRMLTMPRQLNDEVEIRPAIAEMIKEEERAKMLENVTSWNRSPETTFQHQLQQAWQKSWNQQQSLLQNLRFRERGPLKSWRPETMADAILCVLREGHSLSQAARKYDIPYPTFVLYANRVHNLLGPSLDGPGDMRPKGRGRPQRILLGHWTDETIKNVIRAVVFRDTSGLKEQMENKAAAVAAMANAAAFKQVTNSSGVLTPGILTQTNGRSAGPSYPMSAGGGPSAPRALPHPSMMHGSSARAPAVPGMMHGSSARAPGVSGMPLARAQPPNLLGYPDLSMMMGFFPPGMLAPAGTVPRIRLPLRMPGADAGMGGFSPVVRGAGRPVPPLSAVNGPEAAPTMLPPAATSASHSFLTRPQEGSSGALTAAVSKQRVDDLNAADVTCLLEPIQEMTEGSPQSMTTAVASTDDDQSLTRPAVDMTEPSVDDLLKHQFDKSPPCDASSALPHLEEVGACRNVFGGEDEIGDSMFPSFSAPSDDMDMEDHASRVARFTLSPPQPVLPDIGHVASAATPAIAALQASP